MLCWIDIDAAALRHNYRQFCRIAGRERVAPVLKSNAYGHGLAQVYAALEPESPPWLCVNYMTEARALRGLGYRGRLLVVGPAVARELPEAAELKADVVVGNADVLAAWAALADKPQLHAKFDTGMSRQGFLPDEAGAVAQQLAAHKTRVAGVCTHFANVEDVTEHEYARQQLSAFNRAAKPFADGGFQLLRHASASASCLLFDEARLDLDRVGVSLYGVWPSQVTRVSYLQLNAKVLDLHPALSWRAEVTTVKPVRAGQFIGYGCTFRAIRDMTVAVLPVGYFEGFPRIAGEHASYVLIHGRRCPIVGRICMNMMMVDASHVPEVAVGDVATLIGADGGETIHAHDVAGWAKTIHYELLSRLHHDIPRHLRNESAASAGS